MKEFEKKKKYTLNYSKTELEYSKELLKSLISNDDIGSHLKELLNKNEDKEEVKTKNQVVDNKSDLLISLSCNHEVSKDKMIKYVLELFINCKAYEYSCLCEACKKIVKLKYIPLYCDCTWTKFGEKIKFNNDLSKADYGKCSKGHPFTSIDLGLVNDFVSFNFTSLMVSDYPKENKELVNSFNNTIKRKKTEDIAWILKYTKAVTKLNLSYNNIGYEGGKVIGEALRINTTLTKLNLHYNEIGDKGGKVIGEALRINKTLTKLNLSSNNIEYKFRKIIGGIRKKYKHIKIIW